MKPYKLNWRVFSILFLLILTACGGSRATPAPTLDTNAVYTQAAQTVAAQLTQTAAAAMPTETPLPTDTTPPTTAATFAAPTVQLTPLGTAGTQPVVLPTSLLPPLATVTGALCNNSAYISDVGVADGAILKPGQAFQKWWLVQNTGTCRWGIGYSLVQTGGNTDFGVAAPYVIRADKDIVLPGKIAELSFHMVAPKTPGKYEAFFQMYSDKKVPFGTGLSISIEVHK